MDAEDGRDLEMKVGGMVEVEGRGAERRRSTLSLMMEEGQSRSTAEKT